MTTLLGLSGSLRAASCNTMLVHEAARLSGADRFDVADLNLPLYSGDIEAQGIPAAVTRLAEQIAAADAVMIATPEYNAGLSGVLKNALDWVSRTKSAPWSGKPVALMSAAAGRSGGGRAQFSLRLCMVPFRARVLPGPEMMVADCANAFGEDGRLVSERYLATLQALMDDLRTEAGPG